ncbi:MAG: hypothetical protein AAFZ07_26830 [Actinomycetota bacterium]
MPDSAGPVAGASGAEVVSRGPTLVGVLAVAIVVAGVIALAASRLGTEEASDPTAPPPSTGAASSTTSTSPPPTTTSLPTTTTPAMATTTAATPPSGFVDVAAVPEELRSLTVVVFGRDFAAALDLGSGELTPFAAREGPSRSDVWLRATTAGIVERSNNGQQSRFIDWSWSQAAALPAGVWPGGVQSHGDLIWFVVSGPTPALHAMIAGGEPTAVRVIDGWLELVGSSEEAALISSLSAGRTYRIDPDGGIEVVHDSVALGGGNDWLIVPDCDTELRCERRVVDLRTGTGFPVGEPGSVDGMPVVTTSADGRRGLVTAWGTATAPTIWIIDADDATVSPVHDSFGGLDTDQAVSDPDLRYVFEPRSRRLSIGELSTGERSRIDLPELITHVLVAPDGWSPPGQG